ncbi:RHS repeat-associated core domain-containing protein [Collimonas pratensis]|uniref:RHS repeat-associated core domain protein n=1 Tax=Collimonas pratensis TaxID=279113 RepID=A0ABM5ZAE9_9BURK|nr:RHS repeat-associated core domain-containing protein [Collimonas pratensis]AMP16085.1 RHS repeat-associated core domain protein [Collimonas pratensis]
MTNAAKHFDPQIGIDIHMYQLPPGPLPTAHISMVLDPFDYLPFIGATVQVAGVKRATAGTQGLSVHIPLGVWMPPLRAPEGPQFDDQIFMGSKTVLADGSPFSRLGMPVLDCSVVGMVPPFRLKKSAEPHMSMTLPTSVNLAIPDTVFVGGPPSIMEALEGIAAQMALAGLLKGLGKGLKALRETKAFKRAAEGLKTKYKKLFENMEAGFLKCKVLRAEPVDIRDGSVAVSHQDFFIPGRLSLSWVRNYSSSSSHDGMCGYGWQTPADFRLEIDADGTVLFFEASGAAVFPHLPAAIGIEHAVTEFVDGARLIWVQDDGTDTLQVLIKDDLRYIFRKPVSNVTSLHRTLHLPIDRIEDLCGNHWRFERVDGHLTRIVESGIHALPGRFIEVHEFDGKIHQLSLHDPATGLTHPLVAYKYQNRDMVAALDALNAARTFDYDRHHMVRHADRLGLSFHYAYDSEWRVVHACGDQGLHDYRFVYNELLSETEVTDSLGHTTLIKFDENNLPLCEIDPLGGVTIFEYDEVGRTTAIVDAAGLRTQFDYDERGNLLKLVRPDGTAVCTVFDNANRATEVVDPLGRPWRRSWDECGRLLEQSTPMGSRSRFTYDGYGQLITRVNPRGAATALAFDRYGKLAQLTDPLGHRSHFEHDALGNLKRRVDAAGDISEYRYDAKGRLLQIRQADGHSVHYDYDAEDQLISFTDQNGTRTCLEYIGTGQISRRVQADGHTVQYLYDTEEQLIGLVNQRQESYRLKRDCLGRIVEEVDYWEQSRHYRYDAGGNLLSVIDPLGKIISYATDSLGRIIKKTLPDSDNPALQIHETFRYDKNGAIVEISNSHRHISRKFDADGRIVGEVQDGFQIEYCYDEANNRLSRQTSAGNKVVAAYDLRNQVSAIAINDEPAIVIERDALGRAVKEQIGSSIQRQLCYDKAGHLTAQTVLRDQMPLFSTSYEYDRAGNQIRRSDSEHGHDFYQYDPLGNLLRHTDPAGRVKDFLNDPAGDRLHTRIRQTGMLQAAGGEGRAETLWSREGSHEGVHYVFDRAGNLVRRGSAQASATEPPATDSILQLHWDASQRLIESSQAGEVIRYGYDPLGRRVFKRNSTYTTWFFWDGDALLGEVRQANDTESADIWPGGNVADFMAARKRLAALKTLHAKVREYVYYPNTFVPLALIDRQAKVAKKTARADAKKTYINTAEQRNLGQATAVATRVSSVPPVAASASLCGGMGVLGNVSLGQQGEIASRPPGGNDQVGFADAQPLDHIGSLNAGMQLGSNTGASSTALVHVVAAAIRSVETSESDTESVVDENSNGVFHYHNDYNGCPSRLTDGSGQVVWSASYAAWGTVQQLHMERVDNPIRFQGQYFDTETGLHYNRNRYYDPHIGQFVGQDPIGLAGGNNPYAYGPNPTGWIDPLGLSDKPLNSPTVKKWLGNDGTIHQEIDTRTWVYTDWEGNVVRYPDGHPDFTPYEVQRVSVPDLKGNHGHSPGGDFGKADALAELAGRKPADYSVNTWHHHEDMVTMQEVPKKIHNRFTHAGGVKNIKARCAE